MVRAELFRALWTMGRTLAFVLSEVGTMGVSERRMGMA